MKGIFKIVSHSADTKSISVKFNRLYSQTSIEDCGSVNINYESHDTSTVEVFASNLLRRSGQRRIENQEKKRSILSANSPSNVSGKFSMDDLVGKVIQGEVHDQFKSTLPARKVEL